MSEVEKDIDLSKYSIRTDLALEAHQLELERTGEPSISGVEMSTEEKNGIRMTICIERLKNL